jgi:hypothetical protein
MRKDIPPGFTRIPMSVSKNKNISFASRGLYADLLSRRDKPIKITHLLALNKIRREPFHKMMAELASQGITDHLPGLEGYSTGLKYDPEHAKMQALSPGDRECEWCHEFCHLTHQHHYPIPLRHGGTETVSICGRCHADFHFYEKRLSK